MTDHNPPSSRSRLASSTIKNSHKSNATRSILNVAALLAALHLIFAGVLLALQSNGSSLPLHVSFFVDAFSIPVSSSSSRCPTFASHHRSKKNMKVLPVRIRNTLDTPLFAAAAANDDQSKNKSQWAQTNSAPYVPDGLSAEQYAKLKKKEADDLSKKNFGAWGPRFRQGARPDGDWMVMSSLWTRGFDSNAPAINGAGGGVNGNEVGMAGGVARASTLSRVFLLSYIVVAALHTCIGVTRGMSAEIKSVRQLSQLVWQLISFKQPVFFAAAAKTVAIQGAVAGMLTRPLISLIGIMNRKRLWSPRRTQVTVLLSSFGLLLGWSALSLVASKIVLG